MSIHLDFDTDRWVYVPERFPWNGLRSAKEWARFVAQTTADAYDYTAGEQANLSRTLVLLTRYPRLDPGLHRFILLGTPDKTFELVQVVDSPTVDAPDDALLGLPEARATKPPEVTEIEGGLGTGRRAVRYVAEEKLGNDVVASVNWAWRTGEQDVVVMYGTANIVQLESVLPLIDAFATSITTAQEDPGLDATSW